MQPTLVLANKHVLRFMHGFSKVKAVTYTEDGFEPYEYIVTYLHSSFAAKLNVHYSTFRDGCSISHWEVVSNYDIDILFKDQCRSLEFCLNMSAAPEAFDRYYRYIQSVFEYTPTVFEILELRFKRQLGMFKTILKKAESYGYTFRELIQNFHDDAFFTAFMSPMINTREELDQVLNSAIYKSSKPQRRI